MSQLDLTRNQLTDTIAHSLSNRLNDITMTPTTVQGTNDMWLDIVSCVKGNRDAIAVLTSAMHI